MRFNSRSVIGLLSAGIFCLQTCAFAQEATTGKDVDLSSTQQTVAASKLPEFNSVSITVGQAARTVTQTDFLTPAETVAVMQVLRQGQQSILLGAGGNAVGGTFNLSPHLAENLKNLVIPQGVTVVSDFARVSAINVSGNLVNSGTLYAVSTNSAVTQAVINSANISNMAGATISSMLPTAGLAGYSNLSSTLSLVLNATNNIYNAGTIASAGNLTMTAGGSITNAASSQMSAVMQAVNNINMISSNIVNSGVIAAQMGNINIASHLAQDLIINNVGGRLQALMGSINIRDASFTTKNNALLWGGDVVAQQLNLYSGTGIVNVNVRDLIGMTNIYAGEAHVRAATNMLNLGTVELSGDPTFYNTLGDVTINSSLVFAGAPLAIVAKGDIITASGAGDIKTSSTTTHGGAITMIAGADLHIVGSGPDDVLPPGSGDTTTELEIRGASSTGGSILLSSPAITALESEGSTSSGTGDGGHITLIAFADPDDGSKGVIDLPTGLTIKSGGKHSNGNIQMIAGASSGTSITTGPINLNSVGSSTNQGTGTSAQNFVGLHAATPTLTGSTYVYIEDGVMTGSFTPGTTQSASISTQAVTAKAASIQMVAGSNITTNSQALTNNNSSGSGSYDGGVVTLSAGGNISTGTINVSGVTSGKGGTVDISGDGTVSSSSVTANAASTGAGGVVGMYGGTSLDPGAVSANNAGVGNAGGKVTLSGGGVTLTSVTTTGGPLAVIARGDIVTPASGAGAINTSSTIAGGGMITLVAGAAFTKTTSTQLAITGASSTGGLIRLISSNITVFDSRGSTTSGSGAGGAINVIAYANPSDGSQGTISLPTGVTVSANGRTTGANGAVQLVAGGTSGTTISMGGITSDAGASGTGTITVANAAPSISGSSVVINSGAIDSGSFGPGTQAGGATSVGTISSRASINFKTSSLTASSTVTSTVNGGQISILSESGLTLLGTGTIRVTGSGSNLITVTAQGSAGITFDSTRSFDANTSGTVSFINDVSGGSINIAASRTITIASSAGVVRAPNVTLGAGATLTCNRSSGTGITFDNGTVSSALTITAPNGSTGALNSSGASNSFVVNNNQDLIFAKSSGASTTTLTLNAPTTTTTTNASTTVGSGVTISTNRALTFNVNGGNFTDNGTISSTGPSITIQSTSTLQLNGSPAGSISITATNPTMVISAATNLTLASSYTLNPGSTGTITLSSTSGYVEVKPNVTITLSGGGSLSSSVPLLTVSTPQLIMGDNSILSVQKTSNLGAQFSSPTSTFAVQLANAGASSITTTGSSVLVTVSGGSSLIDFSKTSGLGTSSLAITGGTVTFTSGNALAIASSVTVSTNQNITVNSNVITNNGTLTNSLSAGSITFTSGINKTFNGSGTYSVTGGGAASILVQQNQSGSDLTLTINDAPTFNAGSSGIITFTVDPSSLLNVGSIVFGSSASATIGGGSSLTISTQSMVFGANSSLNSTKSSGTAISLSQSDLTDLVFSSAAGTSTISTTGGAISIQQLALGQDVTFSKTTGTGEAVIALTGGALSISTLTGDITSTSEARMAGGAVTLTTTTLGAINLATNVNSMAIVLGSVANVVISETDSITVNSITGTTGDVTITAGAAVDLQGTTTIASTTLTINAAGNVNVANLIGVTPTLVLSGSAVTVAGTVTNLHLDGATVSSLSLSNTGNVYVDDNVSASGNVTITTSGSTTVISLGSSYAISSSGGQITLGTHLLDIAGTVSAGTGTVVLYPTDNQDIKLASSSSTGGVFDLNNSVLSHFTAGSLVVGRSTLTGSVSLGGNVVYSSLLGGLTNLSVLTNSIFTTSGNSVTLGSGQLNITAGGNVQMYAVSGASPTISISGNGVTLNSAISTTAGSISVSGQSVGVLGQVSTSSGGTISLQSTDYSGVLALSANVGSSSDTVTLTANGWQGITQSAGVVTANSLSLVSNQGDIGTTSARLQTVTPTLTVSSPNRNSYITNSGAVSIGTSGAGYLYLLNNNNITVSGPITAGSTRLITTANNGSINVSSNITSPNYIVLVAHGSGSVSQSAGFLSTGGLYVGSGSGNLGSSTNNLTTNGFYIEAITTGNAYISSTNGVYIIPSTANTFYLHSNGQIEVGYNLTATTVTLNGGGSIILSANITATTVNLQGTGNGNILRNGGTIYADTLNLSTGSGTIGTSSNMIVTNASTISSTNYGGLHLSSTNTGTVTATSLTSGYVHVNVAGALDVTGSIVGTYGMALSSGGSMTVHDADADNGTIIFTAGGGTMTVAAGSTVRADEGNIYISNTDTTSGNIVIGSGADIGAFTGSKSADRGNVFITIGAPPSTPTAGSMPSNIVENIVGAGHIYYGANGITAQPSDNTLNAINANIVFDTGSRSASAIELGGGVTITADPPIDPIEQIVLPITNIDVNLGTTDIVAPTHQVDPGFESPLFMPIAYTGSACPTEEMLVEPPKDGIFRVEHATCQIRHSQFAKFDAVGSECVKLHSGDLLLETNSQTMVKAGTYVIQVVPKTVVLLSKEGNTIKVRPLYESGSDAVVVSDGQNSLRVTTGQEVMLGDSIETISKSMQNDAVGRRSIKTQVLPSQKALSRCEVSTVSLIQNNYLMDKVMHSQTAVDKRLAGKLVKMAASVMTVTNSHGAYTTNGLP